MFVVKNKKIFIFLGCTFIATGMLLMPKTIVSSFLPTEGALYFDKLVAGMWCLKSAFILNGVILVFFSGIYRYLWKCESELPSILPFFSQESRHFSKPEYLIFFGIILLALILRLIGANQSLFGDEVIVQRMYISRGLPVILTYFPYTPQHVMYSIITFFFQKLPIPLEVASRLLAILSSTVAVGLTYILSRRIFERLKAFFIMLLSAVSFCAIAYTHIGKSYSTNGCLVLLSVIAMTFIIGECQKARGWVLLGIALGSLLYMHIYNVYLVLGLLVSFGIVFFRVSRGDKVVFGFFAKRLLMVMGLVGCALFLLYSVQIPQILDQFTGRNLHAEDRLSLNFFKGCLTQMTFWGNYRGMMYGCLFFSLVGVISLLRRATNFAIIALVPVSLLITSAAMTRSFIYPRYVLFVLPFFLIFCVEGVVFLGKFISKQKWKNVAVVVFTVTFIFLTTNVLLKYYKIGHQNIRGACEFVANKVSPSDIIISYGMARDMFPFYDSRIKAVKTGPELADVLTKTKGNVYLLYGYESVLRNRIEIFNFIKSKFVTIKHFPGMFMENTDQDGDVFVLISKE